MHKKIVAILFLTLGLSACNSDQGHRGTPSDPNEQQGNPNAKPEESMKPVSNHQDDGDKASKDPHPLTQDNTAGTPKKK